MTNPNFLATSMLEWMKAAREVGVETRRVKRAVPSAAPPTEKSVVRGGLVAWKVEVKLRSIEAWVVSTWNVKLSVCGVRNA